jgi:hypothetical protein
MNRANRLLARIYRLRLWRAACVALAILLITSTAFAAQPLTGTFKGASSDVLVRLAGIWIERFRKYHPDVDLSISPPYAGSLGAIELVKDKKTREPLDRKTCEPIAHLLNLPREPLQDFVGVSSWKDLPILQTIRQHVTEVWHDPQGVFSIDGLRKSRTKQNSIKWRKTKHEHRIEEQASDHGEPGPCTLAQALSQRVRAADRGRALQRKGHPAAEPAPHA